MTTARGIKSGWHTAGWLIAVLGGILVTPGGTLAQGADPASTIRAFQDAVNAEHVDAALALFADDAVVSNTLGRRFIGKHRIRRLIQANVDAGIQLVPENLQTLSDRVTWNVSESNSIYKKLGLSLVEMTTVVVVQEGRIKSWTTYFPLDVLARIEQGCAARQAAAVRIFDLPCADFVAQARVHTEAVLTKP
jgi:limonene-1,2-epoxide hydrolase